MQEGDRVLVKILAFDWRHKLSNKWEEEAYVVLKHPNVDIPVYIIQWKDGTGPTGELHRNHLLPINYLPVDKPREIDKSTMIKKRAKTCVPPAADFNDVKAVEDSSDDDLHDDDVPVIVTDHVPGNVGSVETESSSEEEGEVEGADLASSTRSIQSISSSEGEIEGEDSDDCESDNSRSSSEADESDAAERSPSVRRSTRTRQEPVKFKSGEYITYSQPSKKCSEKDTQVSITKAKPDWEERAVKSSGTMPTQPFAIRQWL